MKSQTGFSLIEILIALVILAVGLTGLLGFSTFTIRAARDNDKWTTARLLAVSEQESLTSRDFETLQTLAGSPSTASGTRTVTQNGETYTVNWTLERTGSASAPLHVKIEVNYPTLLGPPFHIDTLRYTLL